MTTLAVKKIFLRGLLLLQGFFMVQVCCAQKESNTWYFGDGAGLNFNTSPVSVLTNGQVNSREGVCSISDKNGSLLFYSDGTKVWDNTQAVMPNGSGLLGDFSSTQSSIVIPNPADPTKYFLFTTALFQGLRYSEVDMTLNSGKGDVVNSSKNTLLIPNSASTEKVIAVQHCNRKDYWVISHTLYSSDFYVYLVNSLGVQAPVIISIGSYMGDGIGWQGTSYLKLSSDGSRLVNVMGPPDLANTGKAEVFNFDNKTGTISGPVVSLAPLTFPYGAEFSLANKFLYISDVSTRQIYQFDLTATDVNASKTTIATSANISYGALQMGPDARIYVSGENGYLMGYGYMSIIANPEGNGAQCNFLNDAIDLNGKNALIGLPTFAASYLRKDTANINYTSSCVQRSGLFRLSNLKNADSVKWDFGDGSPLSNQLNPAHTYSTAGTYTTTTIIYRSCNTNDTIIKPVTVAGAYNASVIASFCDGSVYTLPNGTKVSQAGSYPVSFLSAQGCDSVITTILTMNPRPVVNLGKDTTLCPGTPFVLDAGPGFASWLWQNATTSQTQTVASPGLFWVEVMSASTGCANRDSITILAGAAPAFTLGKDTMVCTGQPITIGNIIPGAVAYTWSTGAVSPQIAVANPGIYWMQVAYNNQGCTYRDSVTVTKNPVNDFTLGPDTAFCQGNSVTLGSIIPGAGYVWSNGSAGPQINISNTGLYWQELNLFGCTRRDSVEVFNRLPPVVIAQKSNDIDCGLPAAQLTAAGAVEYTWLPAIGLNDAFISNPVASVNTSTTYFLKGTDNYGCSGFDTISVKVTKLGKTNFNVPNAFTPNGDGYNDCFGIRKSGIAGLTEFSIYNRFGQKVFTTNNPGNCWDGRYKGKMQDPGGFVYIIKASSICGEVFRKGIVMLIR